MTILLLIAGFAAFAAGYIILLVAKKLTDGRKTLGALLCMIGGLFLAFYAIKSSNNEFNSKKYTYRQEVRSTIVNDNLIKRDTIFIIERKNN